MSADILFGTSLTSAIDFSTEGHVGQEETPSRNQAYTLSEQFRTGILPSRFFGREEVEKRERNNTHGRVFSADRFTAKHLTMLGLFGVHLSTRRAKKKKKRGRKRKHIFSAFKNEQRKGTAGEEGCSVHLIEEIRKFKKFRKCFGIGRKRTICFTDHFGEFRYVGLDLKESKAKKSEPK